MYFRKICVGYVSALKKGVTVTLSEEKDVTLTQQVLVWVHFLWGFSPLGAVSTCHLRKSHPVLSFKTCMESELEIQNQVLQGLDRITPKKIK